MATSVFEKAIEDKKPLKDLPTILSFTRNIEPSDGLMYSGKWEAIRKENSDVEIKASKNSIVLDIEGQKEKVDLRITAKRHNNWREIPLTVRKNRGTFSHSTATDAEKKKSNLAEGDKASLFDGDDTLKLSFTLKILGNVGEPTACNEPVYEKLLKKRFEQVKEKGGLDALAKRYAYNIANARFLFRNRVNAEEILVTVENSKTEDTIEFNAYDFSTNSFDKNSSDEKLTKLTDWITTALSSDTGFAILKVVAYAKMGNRSQVFPSQEMNVGESRKTLFQLEDCAGMHDVKLGNAIRTIDTWHTDDAESEYYNLPFAIEPFGAVVQKGVATRESNNKDLYTYLKKLPVKQASENIDDMDLFFVANLIRGGLFQGKGKK